MNILTDMAWCYFVGVLTVLVATPLIARREWKAAARITGRSFNGALILGALLWPVLMLLLIARGPKR